MDNVKETMQAVRSKRLKLAADITELIQTFEAETLCVVANLRLEHEQMLSARPRQTVGVEIELDLA